MAGRLRDAAARAFHRGALALCREDPEQVNEFLNACSNGFARTVVERMWELGDEIWLKYVSGVP